MSEIKLKARLQNKYETLEEWNQLDKGKFIPLKGEICYSNDKGMLYQKIGDGITDFVDLPWLLNQSDWLESDKTSPSYIQNRIAYTEVAEGDPILEIKYVNNDGISGSMVIENNVAIICEGREFVEEDIGKLWSFNLKCVNADGTNPLEIDIPGPVELKTFESDGDIIYYYGNFYRFYIIYAIMELQDEIAAGDITVEDIEQIVRDELQIEDTNENYAFVNMYGTIIGAMFGVTPDDPNNFNYEFSLSSYPTIVHKLDSKYLQDVDLVGKFQDIEDYNEIFNDYANNRAHGTYAHVEGKKNSVINSPIAVHIEGCENRAGGNYAHVEGYRNEVGIQGMGAHAEGSNTQADYSGAHAEGCNTIAIGSSTHAEGSYSAAITRSWEQAAHAEGKGSYASGVGAHAEGGSSLSETPDQNGTVRIGSWSTVYVQADGRINISSTVSDINPKQIYMISDEISAYVTREGYLASGTLSEEIIQARYLHNVTYQLQMEDFGAAGDYSHVEGYNNTALDNYSHVEGTDNYVSGRTSHVEGSGNNVSATYSHVAGTNNEVSGGNNYVSGQYNKISGSGHFIFGEGLINNGSTSSGSEQIVLGKYNQNDQYADLIIGDGSNENNRHNALTFQNGNLQVSGLINDKEEDVWKKFETKPTNHYNSTKTYYLEDYNLSEFSQIVNPNLVRVKRTAGTKTIKVGNGNLLPLNWIESQTLDNGTTVTLNEDLSVTISAVSSDVEQTITISKLFANWDQVSPSTSYRMEYYCWDETSDNEIYYTIPSGTKINDHLTKYSRSKSSYYAGPDILIKIAPNTEKTITLLPPCIAINNEPRKWVPPMEMIQLDDEMKLDLNNELFKNQIGIGYPSTKGTNSNGQGLSFSYTPKTVINENRMGIILDDLKEEISTSLILKSPNGTKFNITVNDDGTLSATQI